jgi:3-methyladenine DNA glycosylase/8-oxoguanine DNA glycosylase
VRTPEGPATLRLVGRQGAIVARAWGPGAGWAIAQAPDLVGARDSLDGFEPVGIVRDLHRRFPGLRIARTRRVFDALVPTILEQKVTSKEAAQSYGAIVKRWGTPAPAPAGAPRLVVPPAPEVLAHLAYWELHEHGVERRRAETIRVAATRAARVEEANQMDAASAKKRLEALPGIGPWTSAQVCLVALGDPNAVPTGDYHLPNLVAHAFTGAARGTDAQMLELLAPYAGHRGRVVRLLQASGIEAPRFGPRRRLRRIAEL